MELLIPLDLKAKTALYEQIYAYIRREIRNGSLKAEERLPSTRVLAENLKVSRSTTQMAYDQLLAEGYLKTTPDSYMIVKLTEKSEALIAGQETFTMKMAKEPEKEAKTTPKKKVKKTAGLVLNKEQEESFEILRALRAEIAREEKVPPYIVFSDKTLLQMCIKKPTNKNAMLKVSGVGEFKFEKYGERFLEVIRSWT